MAKRGRRNRAWDMMQSINPGALNVNFLFDAGVIGNGDHSHHVTIVSTDDNDIISGVIRLVRVYGCLNVRYERIAGGTDTHLWVGLINRSADTPLATIGTPLGVEIDDDDDNNVNWLWRTPVPVFRDSIYSGGAEGYCNFVFDWPVHGGRGTRISASSSVDFVATVLGLGGLGMLQVVRIGGTMMTLYEST